MRGTFKEIFDMLPHEKDFQNDRKEKLWQKSVMSTATGKSSSVRRSIPVLTIISMSGLFTVHFATCYMAQTEQIFMSADAQTIKAALKGFVSIEAYPPATRSLFFQNCPYRHVNNGIK